MNSELVALVARTSRLPMQANSMLASTTTKTDHEFSTCAATARQFTHPPAGCECGQVLRVHINTCSAATTAPYRLAD